MSKLETITIDTPSGSSALQIGDGNTTTIGLGKSGDTINIPAGATIANAGTATGFGGDNTPYFKMALGVNQSISTLTETVVQFNQTEFDSDSAVNLGAYKYVVPSAGKYLLSANFRMSGGGNNTMSAGNILIYKGASSIAQVGLTPNTGSAMGIFGANTTGLHDLAANDELTVKIYIGAGSARIDGNPSYSFFSGFKLIE